MAANPNHRECYANSVIHVRLSLTVPNENEEIHDKLCIYFQSKQGGNCDVAYIRLLGEDADGWWYRVVFVEPSGAINVLAKPDHAMAVDGIKIPLKVQGCRAPPGLSVSPSSEVPPDCIDLLSFVCISQKEINKDTVDAVTEQNQARQSDDKTQLQMTSTGASGDAQKGTSRIAASFTTQGATQQLSPEKNIKVDPADQASPTRQGPLPSDAVDTESEDMYGETGGVYQEKIENYPEEDKQLIEVTGLKRSTGDEVLKLYFENTRKSGGGEIEMFERISKTGAIRIAFKDQSVAAVVGRRKHKLSGATLTVILITKKKCLPLPIKAQCLFLEGIPDGCSSEHVTLFIENRASMDEEPTIQYGENPGTAICTFSCDIPDLEAVIRKISQRKLRGASLKAEKVHHSHAILVQGVPRNLEMVELYFDNKKKSGGSGVKDVQPGPMDGQAIVYFEDWKVVQDVLAKGHHKLGGNELRIELYHDFLGRISPFDAPTQNIPEPVTVEVQELIVEFLYGKGKNTKKKLLKELTKVKANLQWPDGSQKSQAKLEPVKDDSQHQSWLNWEKEAVNVLTDFMKGCKSTRVPVQQSLWKDAADTLKKMATNCSMVQDDQLHEVILVGEKNDVDSISGKIRDIIIKLKTKSRYSSCFKADCDIKKEQIEDDPEEDKQLIEVTGLKRSTGDEVLKLYFENNRKSGGGEIEMFERISKTGAIRIAFKDQSVAAVVGRRMHKLSGATLTVNLITKKKCLPLPIKAQCLFLKGIPNGCSSEHVTLFIEYRASMDEEPTVQYGEKPGTAICTFSQNIPDLEAVIRQISQRKLRGASLKAEKVHHSHAILVQGVPRDLEMVELYFDNKKKSGGSGVIDVQPGPIDGQAIIYFEDWRVVQDVLAKGHHKLCGNELRIESYHDFLGRLSTFDAPTPHIPKPVSVEVQEPIMEFLYGKGKNTKKKLLTELTKVKANLQWPDGSQKSRAKLEPVIEDSQRQSWLNWEKEAVNVLTDFMKGCKSTRVPVQQSLWKDAAGTLKKMTTNCSMVQDDQLHEVILAGEQKDIDSMIGKIHDTIIKLKTESKCNFSFKVDGDIRKAGRAADHNKQDQMVRRHSGATVTSTDSVGGRYQNIFLPVKVPIGLKTPRITFSGLNVVTKEGMTIKLTKGNIAVQMVDVILNTVGSDLNMKSGKVSHAISLAAGPTLQQECDTLRDVRGSLSSWSFLETGPGLLTCKKIYHCVCSGYKKFQSEQLLKKLLVELMAYASRNGMTSMAIPALGTGILNYPPAVTARCMYEAAFEFSSQHSNGSLKDVRFIVYNKDMNTIKGFEDEIQRLNPSSTGASRRAFGGVTGNANKKLDFFYKKILHETNSFEAGQEEDLQEKVIPQLGAVDMNSLIKASVKLHAEEVQNYEFLSEDFPAVMGLIDKMTTAHLAELEQIGGKHNVTAEPSDAKSIHVEGSRINVKEALLDISHLFLRIQKEETEKQKIKHLAKEVKWKNSTLSAAIFEKPTNWITMKKGELTKMVKLTAGTDEYRAVETNFRLSPMSAFNQVVEIQRVQNQALLMQYQARKAALEIRLKRSDVEKILFHGTDEQTCNDISRHGFNRSFCGKNANVYGKGTYFAVQAGYSARRDYAKPNANGIMHLIMAKVLVGDYIRGCQDINSPPKKPQSPGELYDSVVDNMNTPGIYVIFHDAQAYPEYIIKFQ